MAFWRKVVAVFEDRTGLISWPRHIAEHPVPKTGWAYVFGSATLVAFILQVVTGIALATAYVPSAGNAYDSLQFITHQAAVGHLLRGLHYFGASAMVILIGLHIAQTYLYGAYKFPREFNWLSGALLLLLTLALAFTGQLLRWDQTAVWSVIVAAEQVGKIPILGPGLAHFVLAGDTVGGATLSRFFAIHVFFIPGLIFFFIAIHLYLVIHNGISEPPRVGELVDPATYRERYNRLLAEDGEPFWPDAAWRDVVFSLLVLVVVGLLAWLVGPPEVTTPPDPALLQAYPRPDWYFLWYFAVLALTPKKLEAWVILGGPLVFGILLLLVPVYFNRGERSPRRRPWAWVLVTAIFMVILVFWIQGVRAPWSPDFQAEPLTPRLVASADPSVIAGAELFNRKGCEACHRVDGMGGRRGPDLTYVADRLTKQDMTLRIVNGGINMPAFANILNSGQISELVAFLSTRRHAPLGTSPLRAPSQAHTGAP